MTTKISRKWVLIHDDYKNYCFIEIESGNICKARTDGKPQRYHIIGCIFDNMWKGYFSFHRLNKKGERTYHANLRKTSRVD